MNMEELLKHNKILVKENENLREQLSLCKVRENELLTTIDDLKITIDDLRIRNSILMKENFDFQIRLSKLEAENVILEKKVEKLEIDNAALHRDNDEFRKVNNELNVMVVELRRDNNELRRDNNELRRDVAELRSDVSMLLNENKLVKAENANIKRLNEFADVFHYFRDHLLCKMTSITKESITNAFNYYLVNGYSDTKNSDLQIIIKAVSSIGLDMDNVIEYYQIYKNRNHNVHPLCLVFNNNLKVYKKINKFKSTLVGLDSSSELYDQDIETFIDAILNWIKPNAK